MREELGAEGGLQYTGQSTYRETNQSGDSSHRVPLSLPVPLCPIKRGTSHGIVVADARSSKSSTEVCHFHFFLYLNITSLLSASEISCQGWRSPSISGIVPGRMHLLDPSVFVRFGSILSEMQESPTSSNLGSKLRGAGQTYTGWPRLTALKRSKARPSNPIDCPRGRWRVHPWTYSNANGNIGAPNLLCLARSRGTDLEKNEGEATAR